MGIRNYYESKEEAREKMPSFHRLYYDATKQKYYSVKIPKGKSFWDKW